MARAFAGPLCRYFAGERGEPVTFQAGVEAWRADLNAALAGRLRAPVQWREDAGAAGVWTDLGAAGFTALRLFAFYADHSELELPDTVPALLELDRDYRLAQDRKFERSRYGHLLACTLWLPADFPFTARVPLPDGVAAELGSLPVLHDQLRWLNQRTFAADERTLGSWVAQPAVPGGPLLAAAQRGLACLWRAVADGVARGLPVAVDESGHGD